MEMTFNGNVNIRQTGHAIVHIDQYDEHYLVPFPDATVRGFFSGALYPELSGTYHITSSTGYVSEITFSGKGFFSGVRNTFDAKTYRLDDKAKTPIYRARGQWSDKFVIQDCKTLSVEECDVNAVVVPPIELPEVDLQDPWESRRAWKGVIEGLRNGDLQGASAAKSQLENAQRAMRVKENAAGDNWEPLFFDCAGDSCSMFESLASPVGWQLRPENTKGVWRVNHERVSSTERPYRNDQMPIG